MLKSYLALLGAAQKEWELNGGAWNPDNPADPYMTLVGYFGSLRELGGSRRIIEDEVASRVSDYGGRQKRCGEAEGAFADREIAREVAELTSRESTNRVADTKRRLALPFANKERVDVAIATNMISVGLDITRLGLMVVLGQPKATAEYIQATSRVGRDAGKPGLVVTLLNVHKPRDRSHYERFEAFHAAFYRSVEASSVTPFAPRALLPFSALQNVDIMLSDFDRVVTANHETGLLSYRSHDGRLKTRVAMDWLEARGFKTRLVERSFDEGTRRQDGEPRLALAGFDGSGPRWLLDQAGFAHVIDCGLGGSADNFDTIALHTLPHPDFSAEQLWPRDVQADSAERAHALAKSNRVYESVRAEHGCGEFELASRSVAVPFVGTTAASLALAEATRAVMGGVRVGSAHVRISALNQGMFREVERGYSTVRAPALAYQRPADPS